ncbi:endonuclease/exonuclease/phosphatase family protein [Jannaschia pohangensis]|uniref:Uncharacterized conserved protein YafD, endonuclease/exonuclease/phosphatase (EEP) superfamily n=1 Tax=Jannaschia pohangensis TaxID=390807 RepID=A0A1I3I770_9RHOB|nr:endonuclease/exonuclease/phosphatase family protein [Jannaschia pohangensis]SFI43838.1 Uncharacterized conserved protein YafD, endonuclease/exonuclease/phosphatase (EEP) superfamily [Jannaschia pohangensis]
MRHKALIGAAALVMAGLAGSLHPAFDSLRIGLPYASLALLLLALTVRGWFRRLGLLLAVAGAVPVAALAWPAADMPTPTLRLLQHNLLYTNAAPTLAARLADQDIATFQEVWASEDTIRALPYDKEICLRRGTASTAVVSRLPVVARGCLDRAQAWMRVRTPAGDVTVLAVHLAWPWPARGGAQHRQIASLSRMIAALPQPVIVAGDFNQVSWSVAVARVAAASQTTVLPGLRPSYWIGGLLPLPIDHVLLPEGWTGSATLAGRHGSDHAAIAARITAP